MAGTKNSGVAFDAGYPSDMVMNLDQIFDKKWCKNFVQRAYNNRQYIVDVDKLTKFRNLDKGIIDEKEIKNNFDKKGRDNVDGGKAEYVNADWKPCPMYQSLNQITKGYILDKLAEVQVNGIDRISHDKKLRKRHQEAIKRYQIDYFNFIGSLTNDQPLPYTTNISKLLNDKEESSSLGEGVSMIQQIQAELDDDPSFALLSDIGALKDGVESAHENMIKYFMETGNFTQIISDKIVRDIMHVRAYCYRVYTSAKDGTLKYHYCDLANVNTSFFKLKDGSDIDYIFEDSFTVTWTTFMEMVGAKLSMEELRKIYEANRLGTPAYRDYKEWTDTPTDGFYNGLNNTFIRLGYFELRKQVHDENNSKYYDVIKKFYYLPIFGIGFELDSEDCVFDIGNLQDMHRFGGMLEQAKYSYVIFRDNDYQSWYETLESPLRLLTTLYNQYQNTFNAIVPRGMFYTEETFREVVMDMIRQEEDDIRDSGQEVVNRPGRYGKLLTGVIKRIEQSGRGFFKRKTGDNDEKSIDPPTFPFEHHLYEDLQQILGNLLGVYNMIIVSVGTNPQLLGQAPKPRQTIGGLEVASKSGLSMLDDMVGMFNYGLKELGVRTIYYDQIVIKEFDKKTLKPLTQRAEQMKGILGDLGVNWVEIYSDMPMQMCGMTMAAKPTAEDRMMIFQWASALELQGQLPIGTAFACKEITNPKLAFLWVMATVKRQQRIAVDNQVQAMQAQQQQQQQQTAEGIKIQEYLAKVQAQIDAKMLQLDNIMKERGMSKNIAERGENKMQENQQKTELKMQEAVQEKELETL